MDGGPVELVAEYLVLEALQLIAQRIQHGEVLVHDEIHDGVKHVPRALGEGGRGTPAAGAPGESSTSRSWRQNSCCICLSSSGSGSCRPIHTKTPGFLSASLMSGMEMSPRPRPSA